MRSFVLIAALMAYAEPPAFEIASIKPSDPDTTVGIRRSGHQIATHGTSLLFLITWAYGIQRDRVYGNPKWLDSVRYDIAANAPDDKPFRSPRMPGQPTALQQMMQQLLADRFKLIIHHDTKERSIYALVVAKGGPKIRLTAAPDAIGQTPFSMPNPGVLIGTQVSTEMLAKTLSDQLGRSVQDRTALAGVFDFTLEWDPDMLSTRSDDVPPPNLGARSSLFTALPEQLGLKLEVRKSPVDVIVVDHIERTPTGN